jgi:formylglycine-generating enzyme required for sulfatase activity
MRAAKAIVLGTALLALACGRSGKHADGGGAVGSVSAPVAVAPGAPRPGMAWVPAGVLRAGSAVDEVPRIADTEMPGVDVPMNGFYIDVLPWPNEAGAIPTTNVSRDEAERLCEGAGKRLCSELEWERACKGPDSNRYEYGATYDARVCQIGATEEAAARRPSGDRPACKSAFGVQEMHGGAWEWTDSRWARGADPGRKGGRVLGVLRGGNGKEGELVSRCTNARPMAPTDRSASVGFRCCAGPRNEAEVHLDVKIGPAFEKIAHATQPSPPLDALGGVACGPPSAPAPCSISRAWTWRPVPNVELVLSGGCVGRDPNARCAVALSRTMKDHVETLAQIDTGREIPEVVLVEGMDRKIRVRGADIRGPFFREIVFDYGRVEVRNVGAAH